jgi:hypothetical protein
MNLQRTVLLAGAGGAVVVWLAAASSSYPSRSAPVPAHVATTLDMRGADLAAEVARLHERLRPTAAPLQTRDLFRYRRDTSAASHHPNTSPSPAGHRVEPIPVVPTPSFVLVGMAEDPGPDGPVRTAIIKGAGDLFLVKTGDEVTGQYRVEKISADVVELADLSGGPSLRLAIR